MKSRAFLFLVDFWGCLKLMANKQIRGHKDEENYRYHPIHGEECGIQPSQVTW
jgi:hypothetical protein